MIEPPEVAWWGRDVADGLVAAHGAGVLHRNLHAGIVGIAADGQAVVGGFATTVLTPEGLCSGVPVHVAPEVARGAQPSPASDIFALGVILYQAVEGHGPFRSATDRGWLLAAMRDGVMATPPRAGLLSDPLKWMLHPDPAQRPTALAVADQLRQLCAAPRAPQSYGGPSPWASPSSESFVPEQSGPGWPPATTDASQGHRNRVRWVIVAAVVAVLAIVGGLLVALRPPWTVGLPGLPEAAPLPPPSPIGDPRTADPCSLLTVASVQRFGSPRVYRDFGYPQSCLIRIGTGGDGYVNLWAEFGSPSNRAPIGAAEQHGELRIVRGSASAGHCRRTVVLGDGSRVNVTAAAGGGAVTDLCGVADVGTQTALATLSTGSLPRRDIGIPQQELTGLDTCSLLDQAALRQIPGLDASRRERGFAGWLCGWGDNPSFIFTPWARVAVAQRLPLSGQPIQIGGRSAQVLPGNADDPGSCEVDLVQRSYIGSSGDPRVELLEISVVLDVQQPTDTACHSAKALAEVAASKLPPAS
jgi:hypothetical protein